MNKKFKVGLVGLLSLALMLGMSGIASAAITLGSTSVVAGAGGALTLTANAASTWSTSAGGLTLTGAEASTWSTAAGNLTIEAGTTTAASLILKSDQAATDAINIDATTGGIDMDAVLASTFTVTSTDDAHDLSLVTSGVDFGDIVLTSGDDVAVTAADNITVTTTDGSYTLTTGGTANGDISVVVGDDFTINGATGSIYTIGAATTDGTITIGGAAQTGAISVGTSTGDLTLNLSTGNGAKTVNVATGTGIDDINIGGGGTAADDIDIGDALADVDITGASGIVAGTGDALTITAHAASTWSTDLGALTITNTGALDTDDIAITSTTLGDISVTAGNVLTLATTDGNVAITPGAVGNTITIGKSDATGTISLGTSTGALALNLGTGNGAKTVTVANGTGIDTIVIGGGGTAADDIDIGDALADVDITGASGIVAGTGDALTITAHAASTWSTDLGALTITNTGALDTDDIAITSTTLGDISVTAADDLTLNGGSAGSVINIGTNVDGNVINIATNNTAADTINIGSALDTVNIVGATLTTTGGAFDIAAAGAVTIGNTTATSVSVCNSAACDTLTLGTNADADVITIGDTLDNTDIVGDDVDITGASTIAAKAATALTFTAHNTSTWSTDLGTLTISNTGALDTDDIAITSTTLGDITVTAGNVLTLATTDGNIAIAPGAVGNSISIGKSDTTGSITIGDTAASTVTEISIGGGDGVKSAINIGDGAGANVIAIGGAASTLAINTANWDVSSAGAITGLTGLTVASGNATLTAGNATLTDGNLVMSEGKATIDSTADETSYVKRNHATSTAAVVEVEQTHTGATGSALLIDQNATGNAIGLEITHDGDLAAINIVASAARTGNVINIPMANQLAETALDVTGAATGTADEGIIHVDVTGVLAGNAIRVDSTGANATTGQLIYATSSGKQAAATNGIAGYFTDTGAATATSYTVYIASTNNEALYVDTGEVKFGEKLTVVSGGVTVTAGGATITAGDVTLADGAMASAVETVASADAMAIDSNVVAVTGTTTITTITGGVAGQLLTLKFAASLTVTDNDAAAANTPNLAGTATNFSATATDTLTLVYDGTSWYEVARSVN